MFFAWKKNLENPLDPKDFMMYACTDDEVFFFGEVIGSNNRIKGFPFKSIRFKAFLHKASTATFKYLSLNYTLHRKTNIIFRKKNSVYS